MPKSLPARPNLEQLKNQAKDLLKQYLAAEPDAVERVRQVSPKSRGSSAKKPFRLHDAQLVIALEYGFVSWRKLKQHVESFLNETGDPMETLKKAFMEHDA